MVTMEPGKIVDARTLKASDHVKALDPVLLVITALTACLGAIIGLELITRVGVTPVSYTHLLYNDHQSPSLRIRKHRRQERHIFLSDLRKSFILSFHIPKTELCTAVLKRKLHQPRF